MAYLKRAGRPIESPVFFLVARRLSNNVSISFTGFVFFVLFLPFGLRGFCSSFYDLSWLRQDARFHAFEVALPAAYLASSASIVHLLLTVSCGARRLSEAACQQT